MSGGTCGFYNITRSHLVMRALQNTYFDSDALLHGMSGLNLRVYGSPR